MKLSSALCSILQFLILTSVSLIDAKKQLNLLALLNHPGLSHHHFNHPILRFLAEAGHNVTVVSFFPDKDPVAGYKDLPLTGLKTFTNSFDAQVFGNQPFYYALKEYFSFYQWGVDACNISLNSDAIAQVLNSKEHYDVIFTEAFSNDCMMAVAHLLKSPVIALGTCALLPWHYERMGVPIIPSYLPAYSVGSTDKMNFIQRLWNYIVVHGVNFMYNWITVPATDKLVRARLGNDMPSTAELVKKTSLFFLNQHFSITGAKPFPPSVIELAGLHIPKEKPLNHEYQQLLDNAKNGAIIVSWGSIIRGGSLSTEKREGLLKAFSRLKQQVIWKFVNDTLPNKPDNLYISKWLPLRDMLCHPNVKAFMTHGGFMSSIEAVHCGVPVIATPFFGDQFLNAALLAERGIGKILKYNDISEETVLQTLNTVLSEKYLENARTVSKSFRNRPQTALKTMLWWVEYVAETKGAPLVKSNAPYLSRFVYYSLDIYLVCACVMMLFLLSSLWLLKKISSLKAAKPHQQNRSANKKKLKDT